MPRRPATIKARRSARAKRARSTSCSITADRRGAATYLVAPDKFKGSLTAVEAAGAMSRGISRADAHAGIRILPMADGGEGTVDAFVATGDWQARTLRARGVLGDLVTTRFALHGTTAVCEMAGASGFASMAPGDVRGASFGSSYGTGQTIAAALDAGATRIVLGIGGSATNDAGAGALSALGARFLDGRGNDVRPGGASLDRVARMDLSQLDERLQTVTIELATDVDNPLLGPRGASAIFAPQKGATPGEVAVLDAALGHFADVVAALGGRDARDEPGAGAGGGVPFLFRTLANARMVNGFAAVAEIANLDSSLACAHYCFTGEGSIDAQTLGGKVVAGIAQRAKRNGTRTFAFGGRVDHEAVDDALAALGCEAFAIVDAGVPLAHAMRDAARYLEDAAFVAATRLAR